MIDVVFLLLVFFMLAARFGQDFALPLTTAGSTAPYAGPPRLVDISDAGVRLNGINTATDDLAVHLDALMQSPSDTVILRPDAVVNMQTLVNVIDLLRDAGLTQIVVVEPAP